MTVNNGTGRRIAKIGAILTGVLAGLLFIAWWNWRLYVYFMRSGVSDWRAALLVFGPIWAVLVWSAWRYARYRSSIRTNVPDRRSQD